MGDLKAEERREGVARTFNAVRSIPVVGAFVLTLRASLEDSMMKYQQARLENEYGLETLQMGIKRAECMIFMRENT